MDLGALYDALIDNVDIQVWDMSAPDDGSIIFEGKRYDSYDAIEPYESCRVVQIEVDDHGKLYVGIETSGF